MATHQSCDLAIVGGGLAGALIALAVHARHPTLSLRLIEGGERIGGNHLWSFFATDLTREAARLVAPLVAYHWPGHDVRFPAHERTLDGHYCSVTSERLDAHVRATLPPAAVLTGGRVAACSATAAIMADGSRIEARGVIDARGAGDLSLLDCGWQKFVGQGFDVAAGHGLARPVVMDARVPQVDGYRFVYALPLDARTVFVEDTYYSDDPALDVATVAARVADYAAAQGWHDDAAGAPGRYESGVLPVVMDVDFDAYWRSGGNRVAKAGVRAGLFHPTTGYSLPDALRLALLVAAQNDFSGAALHDLTHHHAAATWRERGFYRMLDKMLFRAAEPAERYRVLERFYRLSPGLVARFYAARSTWMDRARVLAGRPPVPLGRAIAALATSGQGAAR